MGFVMNVQLILQRKGKPIWTTQLRRAEATLGRALGCTIRIPSSEVSRLHCRLRIENDLVTVEDLESVNGTFLNGKRVRAVEVVRPGDRLALGSVTFLVEYTLTPQALRHLGGAEIPVLEADDEKLEALAEVVAEDADADPEVFVLDEAQQMHLPDGGDLHDFLIELDDTDERHK
jgi:hypothetical protein